MSIHYQKVVKLELYDLFASVGMFDRLLVFCLYVWLDVLFVCLFVCFACNMKIVLFCTSFLFHTRLFNSKTEVKIKFS